MKILFLNHNIRGRGTWFRCLHLAAGLARRGHDVTLITLSSGVRLTPGRDRADGVAILEMPRWLPPGRHDGGWAPLDILSRFAPVLSTRWDLVHAFDHRPNVSLPWTAARWLGRGGCFAADWCDWWCRGGILAGRRRFRFLDSLEASLLEEGTKKAADFVTVIGHVLKERAMAVGVPEERIVVVPSGADPETIRPMDRERARAELGLPSGGFLLGFVGFAVWDVESILGALKRVRKKVPDAKLLVVGTDKDNELPGRLREHRLEDAVILLGEIPFEKLSVPLGAADVLMLPLSDTPANRARWPNKLGDYLAAGRPVVVGAVGDSGEFVHSRHAGIAVTPSDENYARAVLDLYRHPERREEMGARARKVAVEEIPWERSVDILAGAYERFGPGAPGRPR